MVGRTMIGAAVALAGLVVAGQSARAALPADGSGATRDTPPGIRIWTNHGEVYHHADPVQVFFRTENDAYVMILRVNTDGRVRVLFPGAPGDPDLAHGGETYLVPGVSARDAFYVDDPPGIGYVFAVASASPFIFNSFSYDGRWDLEQVARLTDGRIHGDPYASLQTLVQAVMVPGYADYDTHLLPYYVNQRYNYPRFLCYDCHTYTPYIAWDPYSVWCPRYTLAVYYNPFYFYPSYWYPTRYYRGTNVVYVRPGLTGAQYVFKNRQAQTAPYVVYRDRRVGGVVGGAARGVRGVDIGGVGSIPAPVGRRTVGPVVAPGGRRVVGADLPATGRRAVGGRPPVVDLGTIRGPAPAASRPSTARRYAEPVGSPRGSPGAAPARRAIPSDALPAVVRRGGHDAPVGRPAQAPAQRRYIIEPARPGGAAPEVIGAPAAPPAPIGLPSTQARPGGSYVRPTPGVARSGPERPSRGPAYGVPSRPSGSSGPRMQRPSSGVRSGARHPAARAPTPALVRRRR